MKQIDKMSVKDIENEIRDLDIRNLLWCLKEIMKELPTKRDWLNPDLEKIIRKTIKNMEGN